MKRAALVLLCSLWGSFAVSSPVEDLSSPDQAVRDKAAEAIRKTYKPIPSSEWATFVSGFKKGQQRSEIEETLRTFVFKFSKEDYGGDWDSIGTYPQCYRLDDQWIIFCEFQTEGTLLEIELRPLLRRVMPPRVPERFTGTWIIYHLNGQKQSETTRVDGLLHGDVLNYYPDGTRQHYSHYSHGKIDGEYLYYYPSGAVQCRLIYKDGEQVGETKRYDDSGRAESKRIESVPQ